MFARSSVRIATAASPAPRKTEFTMNSMNADADGQLTRPASRLACDAQSELISSLKYLSSSEIEETVTQAACDNQIAHRFRRHLNDGRRER